MNKRLLLIIVGVAAIIVGVGAFLSVGAQSSDDGNLECEDPLAGLDIRFNRSFWRDTNFCKTSIDLETVLSGGPPPDGIPPIDNPNYESVDRAAEWLVDESPVVAVTVNGETRGYPLAILTWHEIVNTEIGDEPVTVTFCPLCNSAIVFFRTIDGDVLDFGVSGNLRNSDLIMFDRQTDSWWQQFTGEGIVGDYTGTNLEMIPSQIVGFSQFQGEFPDAEVLSRETGASRSYGRNPYTGYDGTENPFLFDGEIDRRLPATSRVLAGYVAGESVAYPFGALQDEIVINDTINERDIVAFWQPGVRSALDQAQIDESRDVGTAAIYSRELEDGTILTFSATDDGQIVDDQTNSVWNPFGRAIQGELADTQLRQVVAGTHFWFAWAAFEPDSIVYGFE